MRERNIEGFFCKHANFLGGKALKLVIFGGAGFPDRTVLFPNGNIFFVEFKTETGKLSKLQMFWQRKLTDYGFRYYVCRSTHEAEIIIKSEYVRCYS